MVVVITFTNAENSAMHYHGLVRPKCKFLDITDIKFCDLLFFYRFDVKICAYTHLLLTTFFALLMLLYAFFFLKLLKKRVCTGQIEQGLK